MPERMITVKGTRDPKGVFISRESAVTAWLPLMMGWIWRKEDALGVALKAMQRFCVDQFTEQYRIIAQCHESNESAIDMTGKWESRLHEDAQKWLKRRDVIQKAIEELRAINA